MAGTKRMPREARRAQLVEVAASTFLQRGYDGTSMDDVAAQAGVSRLILYRVFDSKGDLYRAVLRAPLDDLAVVFGARSFHEVRELGASTLIVPVARAHPDAFRLLWRHAAREPGFTDVAIEFRDYVTNFARTLLTAYIDDELVLDWAARTAGAHLMEGICTWLDVGDPARDQEAALMIRSGIRAMAAAWASPGE
jgi:AcrR family transcriptional regulator